MTDNLGKLVPSAFAGPIAAAAAQPTAFERLPKAERVKHHRKALRAVFVQEGMRGVTEYKQRYPEAASIRINFNAVAYSHKPKGYDDFLVGLAEQWLTNDAAVARTNKVDIERLNAKLETSYNPEKHFSELLSTGRLKKIRSVFLARGAYMDTAKDNTMSKVRRSAKAHRAMAGAGLPKGKLWAISGKNIVIGNRAFPLEPNGDRLRFKVTIAGLVRKFYVTDIDWLADLLGAPDPLDQDDSAAPNTTIYSIGDLAYISKSPSNEQKLDREMSGLAYSAGSSDAAISAEVQSAVVMDDDYEPLNDMLSD